MKKKNVILMASLSLFAMNCSTLQENLSSEKRNNKVKTDPENADATASKKEDDREHKSDNQNLKNRFSVLHPKSWTQDWRCSFYE